MRTRLLAASAIVGLSLLLPASASAQTGVVEYYGVDALGSVRVVFDSAGNLINRMDYGPFGEQLAGSTFSRRVYAQLFRDGETGQDYAEARMYQSRTGRFASVDPVGGSLANPQSWNRYNYALNSPLMFVDPTGLAADSCTMRQFKLDDGTVTMAYDCSVSAGGGGGPSSSLGSFTFGGPSMFGQQRGSGSGRESDPAARGGRGRTSPTTNTPATTEDTPVNAGSGDIVIDVITGMGGLLDGVSMQTAPIWRQLFWGGESLNTCSPWYRGGQELAIAAGAARMAYATTATTPRFMANRAVAGGADAAEVATSSVLERNQSCCRYLGWRRLG